MFQSAFVRFERLEAGVSVRVLNKQPPGWRTCGSLPNSGPVLFTCPLVEVVLLQRSDPRSLADYYSLPL